MYLINLTKPTRQVFCSTFTEQYIHFFLNNSKIYNSSTLANHARGFDFITQGKVLFENSKKEVQN